MSTSSSTVTKHSTSGRVTNAMHSVENIAGAFVHIVADVLTHRHAQ